MRSDPWREVAAALDAARGPVRVFFRDDDAGWSDARLVALLNLFERCRAPLDLAVIPCALHRELSQELRARAAGGRVGLHQHGYQHSNHEVRGRKCEFGPGRPRARQAADLRHGSELLEEALGCTVDPIFTPPWNRCTGTTAGLLAELGFRVLSRDRGAEPLMAAGLSQLPVDIDWCKPVDGARASDAQLDARIARALRTHATVGIMLHHVVMDDTDLARLEPLLARLAAHPALDCRLMRDCVAVDEAA